MAKTKENKEKKFKCHNGNGAVVETTTPKGKQTTCANRSGDVCKSAGNKCKRIGFINGAGFIGCLII